MLRRLTCQTMTPKMHAISGTSVVSSQPICPVAAWWYRMYPVTTATSASAVTMPAGRHRVKPYTSASPIQMKWNGTVS
jgi:hypothetical protein